MKDEITLSVAASNGRPQRMVVAQHATRGEWRDTLNTNSAASRRRFVSDAAARFDCAVDALKWLDSEITAKADDADAKADEESSDDGDRPKESQATQLVQMCSSAELFHNLDQEAFAKFPVDEGGGSHFEISRIRSKPFRQWLARKFYVELEKAPGNQAVQDALAVLDGKSVYEGAAKEVHVRIAEHDGRIYVDLANDKWQVVEVSADGWRLISDPPVIFRRAKAMMALPQPARGGDIGELRPFVNVSDEEWPLVLAWLVAAFRPGRPFPVLAIAGEQGSAKSTLAKLLRRLVDPNTSPLRSEPRDPRDLMIAANNGHVVAIDNLSSVKGWLSDALCRLSTGGGFSTRTLYEDDDETIFDAMRPCILNGIEELTTRGDLADRSIVLSLPTIPESRRSPESVFWRDLDKALPRVFGSLLDAVAGALAKAPTVHLLRLPRMADFAIWATAAEGALGLQPGEFIEAYAGNRASANDLAIESSPVGKWLIAFVGDIGQWSGTASELLAELESRADDKTKRLKSWPATPRSLGGTIKRLAPNLRAAGIPVEFVRTGKKRSRLIVVGGPPEKARKTSSAPSANGHSAADTPKTPGKSHNSADAKRTLGGRKTDGTSFAKKSLKPEENDDFDGGGRKADKADAKIRADSCGDPPPSADGQTWGSI